MLINDPFWASGVQFSPTSDAFNFESFLGFLKAVISPYPPAGCIGLKMGQNGEKIDFFEAVLKVWDAYKRVFIPI